MAQIGTLVAFNPPAHPEERASSVSKDMANAIIHHNQRQGRATQTATQHAFDVVTGLYKHAKEIAMGIDKPGHH